MTIRTQVGGFLAFFFRSLLWSLNLLLAIYTVLAYWLLYELPTGHWLAGMIMITLPIAWVLNVAAVVGWLTTRPGRIWLSGGCVILGMMLFGSRTFVWHRPAPQTGVGTSVQVFSYNVHQFGLEDAWARYASSPRVRRMLNYVLRYDAPIKCFQEFYTSTAIRDYNTVERFRRAGYRYSALLYPELASSPYGQIGVATFSKYPIVGAGREPFGELNGLVWTHVKVGNDTICVINVHLYSMGIRVGRVLRQDELTGVRHETRGILGALRTGFIERQEQLLLVEDYVRRSPYPVIVTGDFNDTPYGLVYGRLRRLLSNSFEEAGRGFGFTYNRLPGFIRIDQQFHDPRLPVLNFETIQSIRYSDHYPIAGTYEVK